jgi:uncharacterized protein YdeI (YjbR/CyaY-like superfamily)
MPVADNNTTHPKNRKEWRKWLEKNHQKITGVWLIYFKKSTGKSQLTYDEAVEEALCFGWIDSLPRKLDEERSMLRFTPRKPKSVWSKLNKSRIEKLIANGSMTTAGMRAIEIARLNGSWDSLTASDMAAEKNTLPVDLESALRKNKMAFNNFTNYSESGRKQFLFWITSARQPVTRKARIKQTFLMAKANKKPGIKGFIL